MKDKPLSEFAKMQAKVMGLNEQQYREYKREIGSRGGKSTAEKGGGLKNPAQLKKALEARGERAKENQPNQGTEA